MNHEFLYVTFQKSDYPMYLAWWEPCASEGRKAKKEKKGFVISHYYADKNTSKITNNCPFSISSDVLESRHWVLSTKNTSGDFFCIFSHKKKRTEKFRSWKLENRLIWRIYYFKILASELGLFYLKYQKSGNARFSVCHSSYQLSLYQFIWVSEQNYNICSILNIA